MRSKTFLLPLLFLLFSQTLPAQSTGSLSLQVDIPEAMVPSTQSGRLFVFLSEQNRPEPRRQLWPSYNNHIFAVNLDNWGGQKLSLPGGLDLFTMADFDLSSIPQGTYYVQVLWDHDQEESGPDAPGNLYSKVEKIELQGALKLQLSLEQAIPPRQLADHPLVKMIELKSDTLTEWWGKDMTVKASVLLPSSFYDNPDADYPVCYNIAGYGGRYTRINGYVERDTAFLRWWESGEAPQVITVFLDGEGPLGDPYQLDSENSGPYGAALVNEMVPYVEKTYRAKADPGARFLDGCSTGGWVSLALQLFYPDVFGGTWSYSPDPVHFGQMQLINLNKDDNAFFNSAGYVRPSMRNTNGEPIFSIQQEIAVENAVGYSNSFVTSGEQWGAWNALYSPKDPDTGWPKAIFNPITGEIDKEVAEHWKKYDLLEHVKANWSTLGPKLQDKIYVWMGDMDQFYLNNALRSFDDFLKKANEPESDAMIEFTPLKGHCSNYSHREVLEKIAAKIQEKDQIAYPLKKDVETLDGIINAYYEVVSGPEGPRQVARDKSLHHPDAHVMIAGEDQDGKARLTSITLDEYHKNYASTDAFFEREIHRETQTFGHITHVWSTYEYTFEPDGPVQGRGINSIQLYDDGERWWILGWIYDSERNNNPLPAKFLPGK
jgi:enterochelin esterase-like enzyme